MKPKYLLAVSTALITSLISLSSHASFFAQTVADHVEVETAAGRMSAEAAAATRANVGLEADAEEARRQREAARVAREQAETAAEAQAREQAEEARRQRDDAAEARQARADAEEARRQRDAAAYADAQRREQARRQAEARRRAAEQAQHDEARRRHKEEAQRQRDEKARARQAEADAAAAAADADAAKVQARADARAARNTAATDAFLDGFVHQFDHKRTREVENMTTGPLYAPGENAQIDQDLLVLAYQILGLDPTVSTDRQVKISYRRLALQYHPDKANGNGEDFSILTDAYVLLCDTRGIN